MNKVIAWLVDEVEAERGRTADADVAVAPMERARLRARHEAFAEAVRCLRLAWPCPPVGAERLVALLGEAHDGLTVEVLAALAQWRIESALPHVLALGKDEALATRPAVRSALSACRAVLGRRRPASRLPRLALHPVP